MQILAVDTHCHLADPRIFPEAKEIVQRCLNEGVQWFVMGGVDPEDWNRQLVLESLYPKTIFPCFGLHPYFVSRADPDELESAWRNLQPLLPEVKFFGEMGLDFRERVVGQKRDLQLEWFRRQLQACQESKKIAVLHIVRAHDEALKELRARPVRGFVHAFNSSWSNAQKYLEMDLLLSVGAPVLQKSMQEVLGRIPLSSLLLESDAPDQPPVGQVSHDPRTVLKLAQHIASVKGLTATEVVEVTRSNLERLLGRTL